MAEHFTADDISRLRSEFIERLGFSLDEFQARAFDALDAGSSVVVAAPTGSGKTVVAEYAIARARARGEKAFYTTPLKALSNQKYHDLVAEHGGDNVGLLTGDNVVNPEAPIVVMTTEVLRNMIYAQSPTLHNVHAVVLDEVHYLQNAYRGPVWEEVIIHAAPDIKLVCLSATVSNAEQLAEWIGTVRGDTQAIIEEHRPVELENLYLIGDTHKPELTLLPTFKRGKPNSEAEALDAKRWRFRQGGNRNKGRLYTPHREAVIEHLDVLDMLPAIYFIFSRAACDDAVRQCVGAGLRLTDTDERRTIRAIAENAVDGLADEDLDILHYEEWVHALEMGIASHHAGMVPPFKEAVEECFAEGLTKAVFATETLALGINMPARTVVLEKLTKFSGERHEFLTPGEYTQLTGRAGRRGIDSRGYAVVLWSPFIPFEQVAGLASARSYELTSSFRPTYNMAANLVRRYDPAEARHLLNLSFAQYRTDVEIVRLENRLEQLQNKLATTREGVYCDLGDVREYRELLKYRDDNIKLADSREDVIDALEALRPGDIIAAPQGQVGSRLVVLSTARRKNNELRMRTLSTERRLFQLTEKDFPTKPKLLGHISLPEPYSPNNSFFRRRTAQLLLAAHIPNSELSQKQRKRAKVAARAHPVASCPDAEEHLEALRAAEQLENDIERLTNSIKGRSESIARQFDRVLRILEDRGYVNEWQLTPSGERLSRTYHECDLLVVEALHAEIFDGITPAELALLLSGFTFETRGTDPPTPWFNSPEMRERWNAITQLAEELTSDERDAGLPMTRLPDSGFTGYAYAWASGEPLDELLEDNALSGGDFVRNSKQLIDLLRQVGEIAPHNSTRQAARAAADAIFRDLVAASSNIDEED